ncbi:FtsX-like permease family protein [Actinomadura kijaniata]|uniref:FtsX-like permease family protein n=1 Tax=Actinomadura kijaniata TaxID=46161 RepID=UPI003F1C6901
MLRLSWSGFTERWPLFLGAIVTVCLGVALVQSSLLLLVSAATLRAPASLPPLEQMRFDERSLTAVTVIAVTLALSAFLAVFVIASTFAFTVAERRTELALLRLVGATPGHVRRLLLGEATILGAIGAATGVPVGLLVMRVQTRLLADLGLTPPGFTGRWHTWILAVSAATGITLAAAGVLAAARRAAGVRPLEALRDTGPSARAMTRGRWAAGDLFIAATIALVLVAPIGGPAAGQAMAMSVSICGVLALTAFSPLLVPAAARLLPVRAFGALGPLARANLRHDARRGASTAAPLIVLVGLLVGQATALASFGAAADTQLRADTTADLVLESTGPPPAPLAALPGIAHASTEIEVPAAITTGSGELAYTELGRALVVADPAGYARAHPRSTPLTALRGGTVAAGPGAIGIGVGDTVGVRVGDLRLGRLPVVVGTPQRIGGGASLLLPPGMVPARHLAQAPARTFLTLEAGADRRQVTAALARAGTVYSTDRWFARSSRTARTTDTAVLTVVMGLGGLYALIGLVNSMVIATSARRREFATARAAGLTRRQVLRTALLESWTVAVIGLLMGLAAAAGTLAGALTTITAATGTATLALPWALLTGVTVTALVVTGVTGLLTAWSATRAPLTSLVGTRE